jgi:hypothetical protein
MMPLALLDSQHNVADRFKGRMVADIMRHIELCLDRVPSHAGLGAYQFVGASPKLSGDTLSEFITELFLAQSKTYRIDQTSLSSFLRFAQVEIHARDVEVSNASNAYSPTWVQHVNSNRSRDVGDVANTINLVLRAVEENSTTETNKALSMVEFEKADHYHLIACMRALVDCAPKLESWKTAVQKTRSRLKRDGLDDNSLTQGLDVA